MIDTSVRLGIVCPMASEADNAEAFTRDVLNVCSGLGFKDVHFFAVLDSASGDGTLELMRKLGQSLPALRIVYAPENRCVVDAYVRGYREALAENSDWILEIDAGYSHAPAEIPRLVNKMRDGYDCVFGSRFVSGSAYRGGFGRRYLVSRGGSILANLLLGTRLSDMTSGFQLFTRNALAVILEHRLLSRGPFFQTEMKYHAHGLRIAEVPISYRPTEQDVRSSALTDAVRVLWTLFLRRLHRP